MEDKYRTAKASEDPAAHAELKNYLAALNNLNDRMNEL